MCSSRCRCYRTLSSFAEFVHNQGPPCTVIQIVLSNMHKTCEVMSSDVIATVPPPNVILQWDPQSDTFHRISLEVHDNVNFAMFLYE